MIYNTTELDAMPSVESYEKEPTWVDTFKAATKNFTSVSLSNSEQSYFTEERDKNMNEWKSKDPENKMTYDRYGTMPKGVLDKLEVLYEDGNIDAIKNWNQTMPGRQSTGEVFLKFKELQGLHGFKGYEEFSQEAKDKSLKDFQESQEVLSKSDSLSAEMLGTMFGALHDPITLATIPMGGWSAGRGVMMNAARSFGQEAMIETGAQAVIAPLAHSYKKEIGVKTSIQTEAFNAAMAIGSAGLFRGTGSAVFDLSSKGIKAIKLRNPSLGEAYESLAKTQPTQDMKTHIDNMNKVEFSGEPLTEIKTPNAKGVELNNAKVISEVDDFEIKPRKDIEEDMKIVTGKDLEGNLETRSYKEINQEFDDNDIMFKRIQDCILGRA